MFKKMLITFFSFFTAAALANAAPADLPRTGQTISQSAADDGNQQIGVTWPSPRFSAITTSTGDCVVDNLTGLMWVRNPGANLTWTAALTYINGLDYCGYSDWRLPNKRELRSLINFEQTNSAAWLNSQGFVGIQSTSAEYWSSTTYAPNTSLAWTVNMNNGSMTGTTKTTSHFVWPVRGLLVKFSENFDRYTANSPWVPTGNWTELQGGSWNLINGGITGNALQYHSTSISLMAQAYSNNEYTISTQFMPVNIISGGWPFGIVGRLQNKDNWYAVSISRLGSGIYLQINKYIGGAFSTLSNTLVTAASLSSSTWYTLTMKVNGTAITGTLTGGGFYNTVTATDASFASGRVGLLVWNGNPDYEVRIDNFRVTVP